MRDSGERYTRVEKGQRTSERKTALQRYDDYQLTLEKEIEAGRLTPERKRRIISRDLLARDLWAERYKDMAYVDSLTRLPNDRRFKEEYAKLIAQGKPFALLCVDLDKFTAVNNTYGHDAGDNILFQAGQRFREFIRTDNEGSREGEEDIVTRKPEEEIEEQPQEWEVSRPPQAARKGGEEFNILLPGITRTEDLRTVAERIRTAFEAVPFVVHVEGEQREIPVTISIGGALYKYGADNSKDFYRLVDKEALYEAKKTRNSVVILDR